MWWWIKGDGCNITAGLGETVRHVWNGDVDLAYWKLQALYEEYIKRRTFVGGLGLEGRQGRWDIRIYVLTLESQLTL